MTRSAARPVNLQGLPTLTEVIEPARPAPPAAAGAATLPPRVDGDEIVARVLADLQRHADLMLEYRLREAIAPLLARHADALVRELQQELAATLREVVARAVSQELARRE